MILNKQTGLIENPENVNNPLSAMQPNEQVICEIRRTGIGLIGVYATALIAVVIMAAIAIFLPHFVPSLSQQIKSLLMIAFIIVLAVVLLFTYISTSIYKANRWILTTDSLTQATQISLFRKQTSQLSLANLEDVTAEQSGMFQSIFGFGTLRVETAGERSKFVFPFCPNPNVCAQKILMARENFIHKDPEQAKQANEQLDVPDYTSNDPASNPGV